MWPNSFLLCVGDDVLTVACDDDATAAQLRALEVDAADVGADVTSALVHYGVRTHPGASGTGARSLCVVQHGSSPLGRSPRPEQALDGFWRILGGRATPLTPGSVRLDLGLLRGPSGLVLVPRSLASSIAPGWLRDRGLDQVLVHHVDVGIDEASGAVVVEIAAPLVGQGVAQREPVHTWIIDIVGADVSGAARSHHGRPAFSDLVAHVASCAASDALAADTIERLAAVLAVAAAGDVLVSSAPGRAEGQRVLSSVVEGSGDLDRFRRP